MNGRVHHDGQIWSEETTWIASRKSRRALGMALTTMVQEGALTGEGARATAERVLRRNAAELYGLK